MSSWHKTYIMKLPVELIEEIDLYVTVTEGQYYSRRFMLMNTIRHDHKLCCCYVEHNKFPCSCCKLSIYPTPEERDKQERYLRSGMTARRIAQETLDAAKSARVKAITDIIDLRVTRLEKRARML